MPRRAAPSRPSAPRVGRGGAPRGAGVLFAVLLLGVAAPGTSRAGGEERPPRPGRVEGGPWFGVDDVQVDAPDLETRLAPFRGVGPLLARTRPVSWGRLVPRRPFANGTQLHDWSDLDSAVLRAQRAGLELVLVLDCARPWDPPDDPLSPFAHAAVDALGASDAGPAVSDGSGPRPPSPGLWQAWEDFVAAVVERYDDDGQDDLEGLAGPVRWYAVLDGPTSPARFTGEMADYVRLLHHAEIGARRAWTGARVVHGGVDLGGLGRIPAREVDAFLAEARQSVADQPAPTRFLAARRLSFSLESLVLSHVYDVVQVRAPRRLAELALDLAAVRSFLDLGGREETELWLAPTPAALVEGPPPGSVLSGPGPDETRRRARWLATARQAGHADHDAARRWLGRGRAYDVARALVTARLAGADRVVLGAAVEGGRDDTETLAVFVHGDGTPRAPFYALAQARARLGVAGDPARLEASGDAEAVRVTPGGPDHPAWVGLVFLDPDRATWAGDPVRALPPVDVVVHVPPGTYATEPVQTSAEAPVVTPREAPDGILSLPLTAAPVYIWPR